MEQDFATYLEERGFSSYTIEVHINRPIRLKRWLCQRRLSVSNCTYTDILSYIKYLREEKSYYRSSINNEIRGVKLFFDYLINQSVRVDNPADQLTIRGQRRKVLHNLLSMEELEDLYYSLPSKQNNVYMEALRKRDKALLGLLVYQGIRPKEIHLLEVEHLQLRKGTIYIPGTRRTNSRVLPLQPSQIVELMEYVNEVRPALEKWFTNDIEDQLFYGTLHKLNSIISRIVKGVKIYNHKLRSFQQIRSSVIVHWLKSNNLRKTQYMAGHRYIGSTERYVQDDLENLHEIVNKFHPLQ